MRRVSFIISLNISEALLILDHTGPGRTEKGNFNNFSKYWRGATNVRSDWGPGQTEKGKFIIFLNLNIGKALLMLDLTGSGRTERGRFPHFCFRLPGCS